MGDGGKGIHKCARLRKLWRTQKRIGLRVARCVHCLLSPTKGRILCIDRRKSPPSLYISFASISYCFFLSAFYFTNIHDLQDSR